MLQGRDRVKGCFPEAKEQPWESLQGPPTTHVNEYASVQCGFCLLSFSYLFHLPLPPSFLTLFHLGSFCSLGLLCKKTLIGCRLMLWPLCLLPAFSAALTPLTHCKACRTSVRLPRKARFPTSIGPQRLVRQCSYLSRSQP